MESETFIIAFRGTQPKEMQDVFSDMKFWKRPAWEGGKVHTGFSHYMLMKFGTTLKEYFLNMERIKKQTKQKSLYNRHSGAAAATIAALFGYICKRMFYIRVVRVGNRKFIKQ